MDLRELLRYLQSTSNLSAIQRATGLPRRTIRRYQQWAATQGVLDKPLPPMCEGKEVKRYPTPEEPSLRSRPMIGGDLQPVGHAGR